MALDFSIIGAQRAGTTWSFSRLSMHPNVSFPLGKEINLWSRYNELQDRNSDLVALYHRRFSSSKFIDYQSSRLGDVSPYYAVMDDRSIDRLYEHYPKVKIIYILRNPVLRAFSARRFGVMHGKYGVEALRPDRIVPALSAESIIRHGNYLENIITWNRIGARWGAPPISTLLYDELERDPKKFLQTLSGILEIDPTFYDYVPDRFIVEPMNSSNVEPMNSSNSSRLESEVYQVMLRPYSDNIRKLQEYLGVNLSSWLQPDS
jgi:hypothetical protein